MTVSFGRFVLVTATLVALLASSLSAGAQSTSARLDAARARAARVKAEYERIAEAYAATEQSIESTRAEVTRIRSAVAKASDDMDVLKQRLRERIRIAYRMQGVGFLSFLMEAQSFRDLSIRLVALQQQSLADESLILELRRKRAELDARRRDLEHEEARLGAQRAAYREQGRRLTISLSQADALVRQLRRQLSAEEISSLFRVGSPVRGFVVPLDACPVAGPHHVENNFGAPRDGGARRHQGNDIMGPYGTPLVAVVPGTVTRAGTAGDPKGGTYVYEWGEGTEFYYAHLSALKASPGQKVAPGEVVGYLGDSGNARGGPPHLHFEIHPGGGAAIDPYPSLSRVC